MEVGVRFEVRDSRFHQVISRSANLEEVATGFKLTEGPIWHPYERHLTFSDVAGSAMYRWNERDGMSVFRKPSQMANGNTYDHKGCMYTCEHATSRVSRTKPNGNYEIIASHFNGMELNSPNDIVVKSDGSIYFTDPNYGRSQAFFGLYREQQLPFQGVFRLNPDDKTLTLLVDDFEAPNGLCFSHDEKQLYVNDTPRNHIRVFDVLADGMVTNGRIWAETSAEGNGHPDGMKISQSGHLLCAGPGGIHIFDGQANCLGVILLAPVWVTNFAWGDDDLQSLYITTFQGDLYRLRMKTPGYGLIR